LVPFAEVKFEEELPKRKYLKRGNVERKAGKGGNEGGEVIAKIYRGSEFRI